jgi:HlyD family secretion protein
MVLASTLLAASAAEPEPGGALARFRAADPATRLKIVEQLTDAKIEFQKISTGRLISTVAERGQLDAVSAVEILSPVVRRSREAAPTTAMIKWVIDEGAIVEEGARILELDATAAREQVRVQTIVHERAKASRDQAAEDLKLAKQENQLENRLSEIALKITEAEQKAPVVDKEILGLKVEQAHLQLDRTRTAGKAKEAKAEAAFRAKDAELKQEEARLLELRDEAAHYTIAAPLAGIVLYPPDTGRFGAGSIAAGETVKEGQKLLRVCDPKRMNLLSNIHESMVPRLQIGQKAAVRIDAFPSKQFSAVVKSIATVASQQDFWAPNVKVFRVVLNLQEQDPALRIGMSGDARIVVAEREQALQAPRQAILDAGKEKYCFVKTSAGIAERRVTLGLSEDAVAEITGGLKEGEEILRDPRGLMRKLTRLSTRGERPVDKENAGPTTSDVLIQSVKLPPDEGVPRGRAVRYGLKRADAELIAKIPGVGDLVPIRMAPMEVARRARFQVSNVIGTTAGFAERARLEVSDGRFFTESDETAMENVAVLGSTVAAKLFSDRDAVDASVRIGKYMYRVVGVLHEARDLPEPMKAWKVDESVLVPLKTYNVRFGERTILRTRNSVTAEEVELSSLLVRVAGDRRANAGIEAIRELLSSRHESADWQVITIAP